jgi:hypothetical protein
MRIDSIHTGTASLFFLHGIPKNKHIEKESLWVWSPVLKCYVTDSKIEARLTAKALNLSITKLETPDSFICPDMEAFTQ